MLTLASYIILASGDAGAFGALIGIFFVIALAAKVGAAVTRAAFGIIQIGIGLLILSVIGVILAVVAAVGH